MTGAEFLIVLGITLVIASTITIALIGAWNLVHFGTQGEWHSPASAYLAPAAMVWVIGLQVFILGCWGKMPTRELLERGVFLGTLLPPGYLVAHILISTVRWVRGQ